MNGALIIDDREKGKFRVNRRAMIDPDILERERERIFDRCWLYVGHDSELAQPHDFRARTVGGRPLIFCRNDEGHVQVFINSCTHRGTLLCREKAGHGRFLRCFYHAWTFDTSGKLVALPGEEAYGPSFDREELSLASPPRVESYRGFWWVNYDPDAVDLRTYLADAVDVIDLFCDQGLDDGLEIVGGTHEYSMQANWKLLVENSFDGYHAMPTHQRYMEMVQASGVDLRERFAPRPGGGPMSWGTELGNGHGTVGGLAGLGRDLHGRAKEIDDARRARYVELFGEEKASRMNGSRNLLVFPNLILIDLRMGMVVRTFEPITLDYQHVTAWQLAPRNEDPALHATRLDNFLTFWGPGGLATPDDVEALECCQRGFAGSKELAWSDISRGMLKQHPNANDELQMRTFWRRWHELIDGTPMAYEHRGKLMDRVALRSEAEDFLYNEADLLDRWELEAWLGLFVDDCSYSIPPTDLQDADPGRHTFLVHDDRFLLTQRVRSLLTKTAHAEWPHSRTRRLVTNVRASEHDGSVDIVANFAVYRMRYEAVSTYVGTYRHEMTRGDSGQLLFKHRKAVLDLDALRPQAMVSIII